MVAFPVISGESFQSASDRMFNSQEKLPQISYSGEVTYQIHGGKAGRVYGLAGASTNMITLTEMPVDMRVIITPVASVKVSVTLSVELGVTADYPVGVLAVVDTLPMYPNVGGLGSNYLAGYVAHPRVGTIGTFSKLETWTFTWERTATPGTHTIRFYWAVSNSVAKVWADFYCVTVWATKTVP